MTPTLTDNTVRVKIDPPVSEGFKLCLWNSQPDEGVFCWLRTRWDKPQYRTCPRPPGSKLEVLERCEDCVKLERSESTGTRIECDSYGCGVHRTVTVRTNSVDGDCWVLEVEP